MKRRFLSPLAPFVLTSLWLFQGALAIALLPAAVPAAEPGAAEIEQRLADVSKYLASDELQGRGLGTEGLDKAAEYIAEQFADVGLKTDIVEGGPFQQFEVTTEAELGPAEQNRLALIHAAKDGEPQRVSLELGSDFNTLAIGGSGQIDAPLVFAGYGITAPQEGYDDYAELDVKGKVVVLLRKEPQQNNPHSVFEGTDSSRHAWFSRKVANASEHGAAAVILVNDGQELKTKLAELRQQWNEALDKLVAARQEFQKLPDPTDDQQAAHRAEVGKLAEQLATFSEQLEAEADEILPFQGAGTESGHRKMPVFFARRSALNSVVQAALGNSLDELEQAIDKDLKPRSAPLEGWRAEAQANVVRKQAQVKNVVGVLEGQGPLSDQTIVVGAHYDHLGLGGGGSLAPWTSEIHNGADDNASGTAALIEVARRFATAEKPPARRIVFIAFTGEERGLLGSAHYIRNPLFPLERTVAMLNMDMVGRLDDDKLIVHGTGTATGFDALVDRLGEQHGFQISKQPGGFGPSDHSSFYARRIPVLHFFTGTHNDYHRPSDDFEKLNLEGMRRVAEMVGDVTAALDSQHEPPEYVEIARPQMAARGGDRPYLGSIPDFSQQVDGYALMGVGPGSPAEKAGLKAGDVIIRFGESKISGLEDIDSALRKYEAGDEVPVQFRRDEKTEKTTVTLGKPR